VTREELHQLVWSKPMIKVAEQFGVSGSYLARVCSILRVPRPERGYWAKLEAGKATPVRQLPPALPGDLVEWSKGQALDAASATKEPPIIPSPRRSSKERAAGEHALVRGARTHFENGRPVEEGAYLRPYKKALVDITTSKAGLDKALALANEFFNGLESEGYRVILSHHGRLLTDIDVHETPRKQQNYSISLLRPDRATVAHVGNIAIGLALIEMSEPVLLRYVNGKYIREADYVPPKLSRYHADHSWTTTSDLPCGRLRLVAYSLNWNVSWLEQWQETKKSSLSQQLRSIIKAMRGIAADLAERIGEADRQTELARQTMRAEEEQRKRVEDRQRTQTSVKESLEHLDGIIRAWSHTKDLERFFQGVEEQASRLDVVEREPVLSRLALAREFIGTLDPLAFFLSWKTPLERYKPQFHDDSETQEKTVVEPAPE
jgi:hypothetical protein